MSIETMRIAVKEAQNQIPLYIDGKASASDRGALGELRTEAHDLLIAVKDLYEKLDKESMRLHKQYKRKE